MITKHFTIPVFIPMEACPFRCIYCDQEKISGHAHIPDADEIRKIIQKHLSTVPSGSEIEVGFFGGTFTGLPMLTQQYLLETVKPFILQQKVKSIRLSTRPDYIDKEKLLLLKNNHVETIELGAQSMDDEVLRRSGRGHKADDTVKAARMIQNFGFRLGLQMMIGLPGDSEEKCLSTAKKFVGLCAKDVRIYPTLVIKGTPLEKLYKAGKFVPLLLDEAVEQTAAIFPVFEKAGINIIRTGLHPTEGFLDNTELVAGPFHVSFKELVLTQIWSQQLSEINNTGNFDKIIVKVPKKQLNAAVGYGGRNKNILKQKFRKVQFVPDPSLKNREYNANYS